MRSKVRLITSGGTVAVLAAAAFTYPALGSAATNADTTTPASPGTVSTSLISSGADAGSAATSRRAWLQDVTRNPRDYVNVVGKNLPAIGGTRITGAAGKRDIATRAVSLLAYDGLPGMVLVGRTLWAADDGRRTRAVVGLRNNDPSDDADDIDHDPFTDDDGDDRGDLAWVVLSGPSKAKPGQLVLSSLGNYSGLGISPKRPLTSTAEKSLVAVVSSDATAVRLAGFPSVTKKGVVRFGWHKAAKVAPRVWLGELGRLGRTGWVYASKNDGVYRVEGSSLDGFGQPPPWGSTGRDWMRTPAFSGFASTGYATAKRSVVLKGLDFGSSKDRTKARVRFLGVRSPKGGWIVTADLVVQSFLGGKPNTILREIGQRDVLATLAAPANKPTKAHPTGTTPFVGVEAPRYDHEPEPWVMAWAPAQVKKVRSGTVVAPVVHGIALLDLRHGGRRTAVGHEHQSVLIEGLDAKGRVIARARVLESVFNPDDGEKPNPHDGFPQTVIAWP